MRSLKCSKSSALFVLALAAVALAALPATGFAAATRKVEVGQGNQDRFVDDVSGNSTTTINVGDTVNWVWDNGFHSATSGACPGGNCAPDGNWDSTVKSAPASFSHTFNAPGTFPYYCVVHGSMMQGTVIVQGVANAPAANFTFAPVGAPVGTPVRFTDTSTGAPSGWSWDFGDPGSGAANTSVQQNPSHTFATAATYTVSLTASNAGGSNTTSKQVAISGGGSTPCVPDDKTLCLNNGRFQVRTHWARTDGTSGDGHGVSLTGDSGYFWFFDSSNIEAVTKVLNGCSLNNAYWVFAAGLTNVQVDLDVLDTQTGIPYSKENPQGTPFAPIQDTGAFPASCP